MCTEKGKKNIYILCAREREIFVRIWWWKIIQLSKFKRTDFQSLCMTFAISIFQACQWDKPMWKILAENKSEEFDFQHWKAFHARYIWVLSALLCTISFRHNSLSFSLSDTKKKKLSIFLMCRQDFMFMMCPLSHFGLYLDYIRDILSLPLKQTKKRRRRDTRFTLSRWIFLSTPKYSNLISLILLSA